jgi:hypothetical protein
VADSNGPDAYDGPDVEELWCAERRAEVAGYLERERVSHGRIGEWPAWHLAPYVSVWAVESDTKPGWVGWWVICGDLPNDRVSGESIKHPRDAMRAIAKVWLEQAEAMAQGQTRPDLRIGSPEDWPSLAPLLRSRASTLIHWADDDSLWAEEPEG